MKKMFYCLILILSLLFPTAAQSETILQIESEVPYVSTITPEKALEVARYLVAQNAPGLIDNAIVAVNCNEKDHEGCIVHIVQLTHGFGSDVVLYFEHDIKVIAPLPASSHWDLSLP